LVTLSDSSPLFPFNTFTELSPNNRAFCKATDCVGKVKIQKGEFRQATMVTIKEHQSWAYRHWSVLSLLFVSF
jgi:hypothetical protein